MNFEFATAQRIIFGAGSARRLEELTMPLGKRALLLTGHNAQRQADTFAPLHRAGLVAEQQAVGFEPDIHLIQHLVDAARAAKADMVIAVGGGSVIDAGKAIAAMLRNEGELLDYLEIVGRGQSLKSPGTPMIAVPTTAGTGAEVTRNAVLSVPADGQRPGIKVSLRSPHMLPTLAVVDPVLTYSLPPAVTATTGMDALTQCLEPLVARQANPLTDGIAREGLRRAAASLRRACGLPNAMPPVQNSNDNEEESQQAAREDMAIASLCGGLALANARLGAVHGFAGVIGGMYPAPHGAVCARLLPPVFAANVAAAARQNDQPLLARFHTIAALLTGNTQATAEEAVSWLDALVVDLSIPRLAEFGVEKKDFTTIAEAAAKSSSMQGNPVTLSMDELHTILAAAL